MPKDRPLPCNLPAERLILGSVMIDHAAHLDVFRLLSPEDFSLERHQTIFKTLRQMDSTARVIDRITVASTLSDKRLLEPLGGLTFLISLDGGLPLMPSIESYIRIVLEKSALRKIINTATNLINRCMVVDANSAELIAVADQTLMQINRYQSDEAESLTAGQIVESEGGIDKLLNPDPGIRTPWTRFTDMTGGYRPQELNVIAGNPGMGKTAIAMQAGMRVAEDGHGVMIFSLEMSRASILKRMACYRGRVDSSKLLHGYLNQEERNR